MRNNMTFTWLCLLITNMWMIASYFSDKPYLTLIGLVWIFLGTIFIVSSFQLDRFDFKLRMLRSTSTDCRKEKDKNKECYKSKWKKKSLNN